MVIVHANLHIHYFIDNLLLDLTLQAIDPVDVNNLNTDINNQ